jgi:GNAT superfamily N-acetyltransferase
MRGQKLFIRPIERADANEVGAFLTAHGGRPFVTEVGLLGKLVGELVAVLTAGVTQEGVRVDELIVVPELRRKRIGRFMLDELESLAAKIDRDLLIVETPGGMRQFFYQVGFVDEGERMVRRVKR